MKNTPKDAEPALRIALTDNEPLVRDTAIPALHKIGAEVPTSPPPQ